MMIYYPDIMPTLAELAGAGEALPGRLDGISLLPTLLGTPDRQKTHDFLYWEYPNCKFNDRRSRPKGWRRPYVAAEHP